MFRQEKKQIKFTVGRIVSYRSYSNLPLNSGEKVKLFKKHLYRIGRGGKDVLQTESAIARPERRSDLKRELRDAELLGKTPDGKLIFLYASTESSPVMREIGRLREITFRAVEEGTGKRRDNMGTNIPTLYKQYSSLCKPGGVRFLDFNVDPDFSNCVDGLVVVDIELLKKKKRDRYIKGTCMQGH
ncbi:MAG: hypothetical protein D3916_05860 [Candidatus Electrothrix sp. MAN1_4]|nr:hypothetical protein [Candidatus Electrothrix sp. MAN1_4]